MDNIKKPRVLFLGGGPIYPGSIAVQDRYRVLGEVFTGEIIAPVSASVDAVNIGGFKLTAYVYLQRNSILRNIYSLVAVVYLGIARSFAGGRFDVIISPNPLGTSLAGKLISLLTRSRLVIEVNGNFESAFKFGREGQSGVTWKDRLKERMSKVFIPYILNRAAVVKLVYKNQLEPLKIDLRGIRTVTFPNFVPVRRFIEAEKSDGRYLLLIGFPWYLKGVDILIRAFNRISKEFPEYRLKVVGWCPEGRDYFEGLANNNPNIELLGPVEYDDVIRLMTSCTLYVLASRTDSSPRVLREAMASRKPIIASNTDGVPELIQDGYNGLLFENGSIDDLERKMRTLLSNRELAERLAENGLNHVQKYLSEKVYADSYKGLILSIL